ncbi:putative BSD domain-containing protein [Dioscorea sansibarensis]
MAKGFRGVKEDLSELGRHLLDIACFLGPLAAVSYHKNPPPPSRAGAFDDLSEVDGRFDSRPGMDAAGVVLVSEEVRNFVEDLVKLPESWLEFPVPLDDYFDMSHLQREHIIVVEQLVPSLADLRVTLCPSHMSVEHFWKVYFALLHPRLNKYEAEVLSTQKIVEAAKVTLKKMEERVDHPLKSPGTVRSDEISIVEDDTQEKHSLAAGEISTQQCIERQWENPSESDAASCDTRKQFQSEDDVSFSGTEEEDHVIVSKHLSSLKAGQASSSSAKWVQLRKRSYASRDRPMTAHHTSEERKKVNAESSEWQSAEESDFEMVERSN